MEFHLSCIYMKRRVRRGVELAEYVRRELSVCGFLFFFFFFFWGSEIIMMPRLRSFDFNRVYVC